MMSIREKERLAESKFQEWLDKHNIPYWYISQEVSTFSRALKQSMTRRPDFILLLPDVGLILTDVEYKKPIKKYPDFQINADETHRYARIQEAHHLSIWYVFSSEESHFTSWHWVSVSKVIKIGILHKSKETGDEYYSVKINECEQLSSKDSLGALFSKMFKA